MAKKAQRPGARRFLLMATVPFLVCSCAVDFDIVDTDLETDTDNGLGTDTTIPDISLSKSSYKEREEIVVSYSGLPGNDRDWVGLFEAEASHKDDLVYVFTKGKTEGTARFEGLTVGKYEARLFFNDTYVLEDMEAFVVVK